MNELGSVAWPPAPIRTERLVLRESEAGDRAALVDLFSSPELGTYIGGAQPREVLERTVPEVPGPATPDRGELWLGYLLLPQAWGNGYAAEACTAALGWIVDALPGVPVALCTQSATDRSMRLTAKLGFTEVERFEAYGAEQWFGVWSPVTPSQRPL